MQHHHVAAADASGASARMSSWQLLAIGLVRDGMNRDLADAECLRLLPRRADAEPLEDLEHLPPDRKRGVE